MQGLKEKLSVGAIGLIVLLGVGCAKKLEIDDARVEQLSKSLCPKVDDDFLECDKDLQEAESDLQQVETELNECLEKLTQ